MKAIHGLFAALLVCCIVSRALGQTEKISLYADAAGTDCSIADVAPGVIEVHMVHFGTGQRRASRFSAPIPACWTGAVWLADVLPPTSLSIGTSQTDFTVGYDAGDPCTDPPYYIGKMNFYATGAGQPCCEYPVLPSPYAEIPGSVVTVDCQQPFGNLIAIGAGKATINQDASCSCDELQTVPANEATWGGVKALYR